MKGKDKLTILITVFLIITLVSGGMLFTYFNSLKTAKDDFDEIAEVFYQVKKQVVEEANIEINPFLELEERNPDIVGWISIPGTKVNYPVMHTPEDPEYYLHRNFDEKYSINGTPFLDGKSSVNPNSDNILIHAHNMNDGSMFGELSLFKDKEFLDQHKVIEFITHSGTLAYDIIGVIPTSVYKDRNEEFDYHNFINAKDQDEFDKYISDVEKHSLFRTGLTAEYGDGLMTLSTCAYHTTHGRLVVVARFRSN